MAGLGRLTEVTVYDSSPIDRALRGKATILRKIHQTGYTIAGKRAWTDEEKALVKAHYPNMPLLLERLVGRSERAIRHVAQGLGLCPKRRVWRHDQEQRLPPPYKDGEPISDIQAALEDKSKRQIYGKARQLKARRPRRPPKPTGMTIVDMIRRRAFDRGYTMADLDEWTKGGNYFQRPRRYDWKAIDRALKLLGGQIVAHFPR
jgi:hypothetical protein